MTNAFKTSGWPMLLILAEANAFNTSGAYNGGGLRPPLPKWGRRPSAAGPIWEGRPEAAPKSNMYKITNAYRKCSGSSFSQNSTSSDKPCHMIVPACCSNLSCTLFLPDAPIPPALLTCFTGDCYREAFKTSSCRRLLKQVVGQGFQNK